MIPLLSNTQWISSQPLWLTLLRAGIGWHFLWEGWIKLASPSWSAKGYLLGSWGPMALPLQWMAERPWMLAAADFAIPWLLFIAGLSLMLGVFTRIGLVLAMGLLIVFIIPTPGLPYLTLNAPGAELEWSAISLDIEHAQWAGKHMTGVEGSYFLVTKNVVEFLALAVLLAFDPRKLYGLDGWLKEREKTVSAKASSPVFQ